MKNITSNIIVTLLCIIILSGCQNGKQTPSTTILIASPTPIPNDTVTESLILPTETLQPLSTVVPTLTLQEAMSKIDNLVADNGGCNFPCVWGLVPGETINNAWNFINSLGNHPASGTGLVIYQDESAGGFTYSIDDNEVINFVSFSYYSNDQGNLTHLLELGVSQYQKIGDSPGFEIYGNSELYDQFKLYMVNEILQQYGRPEEIYVTLWLLDPMDQLPNSPFLVALYYPKYGFLIKYVSSSEKQGNEYKLGLRDVSMEVSTWNTQEQISSDMFDFIITYHTGSWYPTGYKPIEEACGITIEDFYQTYSNPNFTETLQTPQIMWGYQ
jgi:hypothetical protein